MANFIDPPNPTYTDISQIAQTESNDAETFNSRLRGAIERIAYLKGILSSLDTQAQNLTALLNTVQPLALNLKVGVDIQAYSVKLDEFVALTLSPNSTIGTDGTGKLVAKPLADLVKNFEFAVVEEQYPSGQSAGEAVPGTWQTRNLNTIAYNATGMVAIAGRRVSVPPGRYCCEGFVTGTGVDGFIGRVLDVDNNTQLVIGSSGQGVKAGGNYGDSITTVSMINGVFDLTSTTRLELQQRSQRAHGSGVGLGLGANTGSTEVFSRLKLTRIA